VMKKEGYTTWIDFFSAKLDYCSSLGTPTMCAWVQASEITKPIIEMKRNPYYWKIDTEGNQLPYIDGIYRTALADVEALILKAVAGDIDIIMDDYLGLSENITPLKKNEEKGGYKIVPSFWGGEVGGVFFNMSHEDPVLRKLFRDKRFRIALSVAMKREEINDVVFKGMYTPSQAAPPPGPPFHGEWPRFKVYTNYDPEFKVGLDKWNAEHTMRLRPDGKLLKLVLNVDAWWSPDVKICEMLKKYWKDVGVEITLKPIGVELWEQRFMSGMYEMAVSQHTIGGFRPMFGAENQEMSPFSADFKPNWAWGLWYQTNGKEGEEPPPAIKELHELSIEFSHTLSRERKIQIEREMERIDCENLWKIIALSIPPETRFHLIVNRLKNVRKPCPMEMNPAQPSTWYIEK